jgi:hypothetical protein
MLVVVGELLPLALGVAVSPLAIMIVIVLLSVPGGRPRAALFVAGWLAGLLVLGGVVLAFVEVASDAEPAPARFGGLLKLALGVLLVAIAVREWRGRPRPGDAAALPGWMTSLGGMPPVRVLGLGISFAAIKPKNLVLGAAAAAAIAEAALTPGLSIALLLMFALLASASVAAPLLVAVGAGPDADAMLERWKAWLEANNAVLVAGVLLVLGSVLVGQGIAALGC